MSVLDTNLQMYGFRMAQWRAAVKLEAVGLKSRGGSVRKAVAKHFGLPARTPHEGLVEILNREIEAVKRALDAGESSVESLDRYRRSGLNGLGSLGGAGRRVPSAKRLSQVFKLPTDLARQIHDKMAASDGQRDVERLLDAVSGMIGGHGYETITPRNPSYRGFWMGARLVYVNMGDPYTTTLYYDIEKDMFAIGDWGTWLEYAERDGTEF